MPATIVRLAAGRNTLPESEQVMCFMAGANAVFTGDQMLTTPCELDKSFNLDSPHQRFPGSPWDEVILMPLSSCLITHDFFRIRQ